MVKIKRILVSQPRPTAEKSPYFDLEEKYGVKIDFKPFIKVEPVLAKEFRQQKVNILDYTAVVFTARTAVDHFFRLCKELRVTIPETMKYFCVSQLVANYLQTYIQYRKRKVFFSTTGKIEDLMVSVNKHLDEKFLVAVSDVHDVNSVASVDGKADIITMMEHANADYTKAVMYKTVCTDFTQEPDFNYDMFVFFSPTGISSLFKNFPDFEQGDISIGCMGSTTMKVAQEAGLRVDVQAPTPEAPSMPAALDLFLKNQAKKK